MDFRTWKENNKDSKSGADSKNAGGQSGESGNVNPEDKAKLEEKLKGYYGKSESELTKELFSTAAKLKSEGKLKKKDLEDFYVQAKSFLSPDQLAKLRTLIEMLGV